MTGAATAALVFSLTLFVGPALVDTAERMIHRGGTIEFALRIHFVYATGLVFLGLTYLLFVHRPPDRRLRWLLAAFALESLVLCAVWLLDTRGFTNEASSVTFFSALTILSAAAIAAMNVASARATATSHRLAGLFWSLVCVAFLVAGFDEYFTIHERIGFLMEPVTQRFGLPRQFFQDGVTISYAIGAPVFVAVFFRCFRAELMRPGQWAGWLLIAGIATYAAAVANDTLDFVGEALFPLANPFHFMNFFEEVLELTAGVLFACAFAIALVERQPETFDRLFGPPAQAPKIRRFVGLFVTAAFIAALAGPLALRFSRSVVAIDVEPADAFELAVFADATDGLDSVDELLFVPGTGLLAGNEATGELLRFDADGTATTLVSGLASPDGLAWDGRWIYVANELTDTVGRFERDGTPAGEIAGIQVPEGVAVAADGTVFVADGARRVVFAVRGSERAVVAGPVDGLGSPEQLALDDAGNLYIADERRRTVYRRSPDGRLDVFVDEGDGIEIPETLLVHDGWLYVSDSARSVVHRFDLDGRGGVYLRFGRPHDLAGLAIGDDGALYQAIVSEYRPWNRIVRIRPRGD